MKKNGFGERLKTLLKQKKLTQAQVATAVGTSIPSVNRWTKGGEIEYENLRTLADFLTVNWVWLRYGDEAIESLNMADPEDSPMKDLRREYLNQILENEARMKAALKMAQIINWEWNVLTDTVNCSENATALFGVSTAHLPNCMLPFTQLSLEELITTFGNGQPHNWDYQIVTDNNEIKWFTSRAELVYDAAKRPLKVIGISVDITDRKQAETALEQSEYTLKKIIDIVPVGLWVADKTGQITLANPEVQRIWGEAKYVGLDRYDEYKGWWEKSGEELGAKGWTLARAVEAGETSKPEIVNIETFDGKARTIIMHATPLRDRQDNVIGAIEINQDITALKNTERTLKKLLEQWQAVFDQAEFSVIQLDETLNIKVLSEKIKTELNLTDNALNSELLLSDILDTTTTDTIQKKLQVAAADELTVFTLKGNTKTNDNEKNMLYVIHDERQDVDPMTLIFIFS